MYKENGMLSEIHIFGYFKKQKIIYLAGLKGEKKKQQIIT
jgi:hypothetical protein